MEAVKRFTPVFRAVKRFTPAALATAAMFCGLFANFNCRSVTFDTPVGDRTLYASPFAYRTVASVEFQDDLYLYNTCRSYRNLRNDFGFDYEIDSKTKVVRAFAIMATVTGLIGMILSYVVPFLKTVTAQMWQGIGVLLMMSCLFQGLSMMIMSSSICLDNPAVAFLKELYPVFGSTLPDECEIGVGFKTNIAATALFFVAGTFALCISPPHDDESNPVTWGGTNGSPEGEDNAPTMPEEEQAPNADGGESK
eukprot:CAMPEP_0117012338 /NCGR_PEP_ID=MMETSP0472-20121206/10405_1 /TAXON_ID=693140 ORGANISM="Tiarina fusus, Strain LIS" /NCGR_SAMPLE_ID=MMETSP0472 /ASSEMBLY_ACC=CAM_ASM_000603 /LENGTH=251 /DNA_ID=CAMNT_0004715381 /DNA_START=48 /DNA_END=803 /DNA_ORIENTATION=-